MSVRLSARFKRALFGDMRGFSLVELLLAVVVLGIAAAVAYPMYERHHEAIERQQAITDIRNISVAIQRFYAAQMRLPDTLADLAMAARQDPWGFRYRYIKQSASRHRDGRAEAESRKDRNGMLINTDFDLFSIGPDGRTANVLTAKASRDDIVRANNGTFIGVAADY